MEASFYKGKIFEDLAIYLEKEENKDIIEQLVKFGREGGNLKASDEKVKNLLKRINVLTTSYKDDDINDQNQNRFQIVRFIGRQVFVGISDLEEEDQKSVYETIERLFKLKLTP